MYFFKSMYYFKVSCAKGSCFFTQSSGTTNIGDYRCALTSLATQFKIQKVEILILKLIASLLFLDSFSVVQ